MRFTLLQKVKNLFPNDTRIVELSTAFALLFGSFLFYLGVTQSSASDFFVYISTVLGSLQFISLVILDKLKSMRVFTSLLVGGLFIYMSSLEALNTGDMQSCATYLVLGIANVYAFLVNNQRSS